MGFASHNSPTLVGTLSYREVTRAFATPETFAAGIGGARRFGQCSATELRLAFAARPESNRRLLAPVEVTRACATPQTFSNPRTPPASPPNLQSIRR